MKKLLRGLALLACAAVFLVSGGMLASYLIRSRQEQQANLGLAGQVRAAMEEVAVKGSEGPPQYAESGILYQYDALWQQNHDLAGWLRIDGTVIDYPVMYTPEEPERYLHLSFDGVWAASGCLFIGEGWSETANQTVIYGHHMKDGSMFTDLEKYNSEEFAAAYPYISYDTLTETGSYEILAAFYSRVYTEEEQNVFRYYRYTDLSDPDEFSDYVRQVKQAALYDTGIEAVYGDQLLTLSTCSYHTDDGRFVVVAKKR